MLVKIKEEKNKPIIMNFTQKKGYFANKIITIIILFNFFITMEACSQSKSRNNMENNNENTSQSVNNPQNLSEEEWKKRLTDEEYHILREKGTERAFSGKLLKNKEKGTYTCAGCGQELFSSETKFESGTGWPSYYQPVSENSIVEKKDTSMGMVRTEVLCGNCGGHLGHVFNDGPKPTGLRYCINSVALDFEQK